MTGERRVEQSLSTSFSGQEQGPRPTGEESGRAGEESGRAGEESGRAEDGSGGVVGELDQNEKEHVAAASVGAASGAATGALMGGPPGAVAGAALGTARGLLVKKGIDKVREHRNGSDDEGR